eukprot:scaffold1386_cov119-Isochrysis_galbana.AAC.1
MPMARQLQHPSAASVALPGRNDQAHALRPSPNPGEPAGAPMTTSLPLPAAPASQQAACAPWLSQGGPMGGAERGAYAARALGW